MNKKTFSEITEIEKKTIKLESLVKIKGVHDRLIELMDNYKGDTQLFSALFDLSVEILTTFETIKCEYFELGSEQKKK